MGHQENVLAGDTDRGQVGVSRRDFLQTGVAALSSILLPGDIRADADDELRWFLHSVTGDCWPVVDPVAWSLENGDRPILGRASEGLRKLTPADGDRVIRLVVRRCALNLIGLLPDQVVIHHWGCLGLADHRPFFKERRLARRDVEVVVRDRKREELVTLAGDHYLYGEAVSNDFPLGLYLDKWRQRFERRPDDWLAAPGTRSGYAWDGVEDHCIPWAALKSAWRRSRPRPCPNCDGPTILNNFGRRQTGMFSHRPVFVSVCGRCRRSFQDESVGDVLGWMLANLDADVRPGFVMIWNGRASIGTGEMRGQVDEPGA